MPSTYSSKRPSVALRLLRWVFLPRTKPEKLIHWDKDVTGEWELHIPEWLIRR